MSSKPVIQEGKPALRATLANEFSPGRLLPALSVGAVVGLMEVVLAMSFAALVFSGALSPYLGRGVGLTLFGGALSLLFIAGLTSLRGAIGGIQDVPAAILAGVAVGILAALPAGASETQTLATVLAGLMTATLLTGAVLALLGRLKLGGLVRYLPYPVIGGFLAGTGWLLVTGAIGTMTGVDTAGLGLTAALRSDLLARWAPGALFAVGLYALSLRSSHFLVLPGVLLGSAGLFYLIAGLLGYSPAALSAQGWLMGPFPARSLWQPLLPAELAQVYWPAILSQAADIATLVLMTTIAILLNITGLELAANRDADLNRDLQAAGLGNLAGGFFGGLPGYHQLSISLLSIKFGGGSRLSGFFAAALPLVVLFFGGAVLSVVPKFIVGGLIFTLGIDFLYTWVYQARRRFPRLEYAILVGILLVIAFVGFMEGVAVGLAAALVLFVIDYSRIDVVRRTQTGASYHSRVTRPAGQHHLLHAVGDRLLILQLQGYLFFGTANKLLERLRDYLHPPAAAARYILLDFQQVTALDSTALLSFLKLEQLAASRDAHLLIAKASAVVRRSLAAGGFGTEAERVHFFPDVDYALEWYEQSVLAAEPAQFAAARIPPVIQDLLEAAQPPSGLMDALLRHLERLELPAGHVLMQRGDQPDALYFVESGQVTAQLTGPDGQTVRLQSILGGQVVGELGFYLDIERSADVIVEAPSVVYRLSRPALQQLEQSHPETAAALHRLIAYLLSERVMHLTVVVEALQ